jgi:DNA-binding NtrC family response regulator
MFEKLATTGAKTLLLDLHLPTANAMRLLKTIRGAWPQVVVITMVESACRELAAESIGVGANGFVIEPLDFQILRKLLRIEIIENLAWTSPQPLMEKQEQPSCNYEDH